MKHLIILIMILNLILSFRSDSYAALCAFRNPDRDLYKFFPKATGYRTIFKELDENNRDEIEAAAGQPPDPPGRPRSG